METNLIVLLSFYFLLLVVSIIFSGAIIYHMLTYSREDFSIEYVRSAQKNLVVYLVSAGSVLVSSIIAASFIFFIT